jgi:hypothetical protein
VVARDDSEELNFDRRAPLSMRFEAASAELDTGGERGRERSRERKTVSERPPVASDLSDLAPLPPATSSGEVKVAVPPAEVKASNGVSHPEVAAKAAVPSPTRDRARDVDERPVRTRNYAWFLVAAVVILGIAAMVFLKP